MRIGTRDNHLTIIVRRWKLYVSRYWYGRVTILVRIGTDRKTNQPEPKPVTTIK